MLITICELRQKEVINCVNGTRLGYICDLEFDTETGKICGLIVPGPCKICGFLGRESEFFIPYESICMIGADAVLVDVEFDKCERNIR